MAFLKNALPHKTTNRFAQSKRVASFIWLGIILFFLIFFIINPSYLSPEYLASITEDGGVGYLWLFFFINLIRGFFLIPSTPFLLGGALLFPNKLVLVFLIAMVGVLFSATALYFFAEWIGIDDYLEKKYPKQITLWKTRLQTKKSMLLVFAWSFFPLVPTDLICYVAGLVKMPYRYLMIGIILGEGILFSIYLYLGVQFFL